MGHWGTCLSTSDNIFQLTSESHKVYNSQLYLLFPILYRLKMCEIGNKGRLSGLESAKSCKMLHRCSTDCI